MIAATCTLESPPASRPSSSTRKGSSRLPGADLEADQEAWQVSQAAKKGSRLWSRPPRGGPAPAEPSEGLSPGKFRAPHEYQTLWAFSSRLGRWLGPGTKREREKKEGKKEGGNVDFICLPMTVLIN